MYSQYTIGRASFCDIKLDDSTVSKLHAELVVSTLGRFFIVDCNSFGGTYKRVSKDRFEKVSHAFIKPNQEILLGSWRGTAVALMQRLHGEYSESNEGLALKYILNDPASSRSGSLKDHSR